MAVRNRSMQRFSGQVGVKPSEQVSHYRSSQPRPAPDPQVAAGVFEEKPEKEPTHRLASKTIFCFLSSKLCSRA